VAAGVGGYLALQRGAEQPPRAADTVRVQDTVRVPAPASAPLSTAVQPKSPRRAALNVVSQGSLTIDASPFGEVYIDGTDVGQTPVVEYAVAPGRHTIRIEHPGYKTVSETVQVERNSTVRKRYALLPETP